MLILALDTTGAAGSLAVLRDEQVLVERTQPAGVPHSRRLPGEILAALEAAGVTFADIELYAVASGPGAFTGLRIGIATIQGLAFAHGRPVAAVPALDALADAARSAAGDRRYVGAWMDAARGEVFTALYELTDRDHPPSPIDPPSVAPPEAALARWRPLVGEERILFVGEGALRYAASIREATGDRADFADPTPPLAAAIGRLGSRQARAGGAGPPHAVRPLYVRRPDAELARERRVEELADRG